MSKTLEQRVSDLELKVENNKKILDQLTRSGTSVKLNNDAGALAAGLWWSPYSS